MFIKLILFILFSTIAYADCVFKDEMIQGLKPEQISNCNIVFAQGLMKSFSDQNKVYKRSLIFIKDKETFKMRPVIKKDLVDLDQATFDQLKSALGNSLFNSPEFTKYKDPKSYFSQIWGYLDDNDFITPSMLSGFSLSKEDKMCKDCINQSEIFEFKSEYIQLNKSVKNDPTIQCLCDQKDKLFRIIDEFQNRQSRLQ